MIEFLKCPTQHHEELKHKLSQFKVDFKRKWSASGRNWDRLRMYHAKWFNDSLKFPIWANGGPGRPSKGFSESSERSKRRKTKELRDKVSSDELLFAAHMSQRASGNFYFFIIYYNYNKYYSYYCY